MMGKIGYGLLRRGLSDGRARSMIPAVEGPKPPDA